MPYDLALFDLVSPYVLRGDTFGQWHAALSVIYVAEHTITIDDGGIVFRGVARFSGNVSPYVDPSSMTFGVNASNTQGHPENDPGRRDPWIDVRDAHINFELSAPRVASQKVANAVAAIGGGGGFANAAAVLTAYDVNTADAPPSDYASTEFTLDLLLTTVVLRPPFLKGAKLDPSGILVEDPSNANVKITLPKIKVRLTQGSGANDPLRATLLSLGASGLDDRDDFGVAQLLTMDPPYAFIGSSKQVGIGFRSATLDLSDGTTPPDVLSQFGFDDSWTGVYLPELRLYIAPSGAENLAFDASATNLLIGVGASSGVTGDFELTVVDQGSGDVKVSARFYDGTGRSYAITKSSDGTTATVTIPAQTRMVVDIDGGLTPYTSKATIGAATEAPGRLFDVDFGTQSTLTIVVKAKGSQPGATDTTLTITATRKATSELPPPGSASTSPTSAVTVTTTSIMQGATAVSTPQLRLVSQTSTQATIGLDASSATAANAHWIVDGADMGVSSVVTVNCGPGDSVDIQVDLPGTPGVSDFTAYYRFDHPRPNHEVPTSYTSDDNKTHTTPAPDEGLNSSWVGGDTVLNALTPILDTLNGDGTAQIRIEGFASFESGDDPGASSNDRAYNTQLALNRALGLQAIIQRYIQAHPGRTFSFTPAPAANMSSWTSQGDPGRNLWWKAVAHFPATNAAGTTIHGTATRPADTPNPIAPTPVPDANPATPPPPSWFKKIDVKVRIVRDHFVACEIAGKFDIQTPSENQLSNGGVSGGQIPQWGDVGSQNPADGIIDVRIVLQIDDATDTVAVSGYFGADPADKDGLKMIGWLPPAPNPLPSPDNFGLNFFGLGIAFWPLIAEAAGATANDGAAVELAVTAAGFGVVAVMAGLGWFRTERIVWYGGEIDVQVRPDGTQVMLLVDIETALSAEIGLGGIQILTIPRETPLVVRYKAIGFLIGNPPGQPKFQFRPFFDSSKGYTIDVSKPGAIQVHSPFDKILKILGARLARNNPFLAEIDLGFAIDLGVVTIERARIRLNLDPGGPPELTAFAASIDIPGAVRGRGSIEMGHDAANNFVIAGSLDLTIVPVQVRIAATLQIAQIPPENGGPATGVKVTIEVDFPVAIPLGCSGMGIYGFIGLFAVNFKRDESKIAPADSKAMAPALAWLKATGGDPTKNEYWTPNVGSWAFGVGALLGTEGSDFLFNLKGILILELPGPRLLLMMKAKLLSDAPAPLKGTAEGLFLAVVDLDFGRGTLTIGLSIDYNVDPLLSISIPVEAFFNFDDTSDWHIDLGKYDAPVHAVVLSVFEASGYLMLSGNGIPAHPAGIDGKSLPEVHGFSIATGLHVSFKWGSGPLYAQLAAGFDAVVGFSPFRMAGILSVRGTLHLFIIDISAWAELDVDVGDDGMGGHIAQITGEICGKIDFLFFSISGCVSFSLGGDSIPSPPAPDLVKGMKLVSRSPALVTGTGVGKPIDASLGDAVESDAGAPGSDAGMPVVPIDAVPAIMMAMPPLQNAGLTFLGQAIGGTPHAPGPQAGGPAESGWVQRGDMWYQYTVQSVDLIGPVTAGSTPAVWWNTMAGDRALEAQLALLSWVPDPTPKAVGSSKYLDETTHEKWGSVCKPAAPPAPVLWTFFFQVLGPSDYGWYPLGLAHPDPADTTRSTPADTYLKVTERWRCGNPAVDKMRGIVPAEVEGAAVKCPKAQRTPATNVPRLVPANAIAAATRVSAVATSAVKRLNPIDAIRGGVLKDAPLKSPLVLTNALKMLSRGDAVSRAELASMLFVKPAAAASQPQCFGWALASPIFDDGKLIEFGDQDFAKAVKEEWAKRKFRPGPLDDAVVFDFGEDFEYARFFMWVPLRFLEGHGNTVVVAVSDENDNLFDEHIVGIADRVPPIGLPTTWTAAASPWEPATIVLEELAALAEQYAPVFVEVKGRKGAHYVQIGCLQTPESRKIRQAISLRPFYVGGIEALKSSEAIRSSYDTTEHTKSQGVLNDALGLDSADNALLQANQTYEVRITWSAKSQQRSPGKTPGTITTTPSKSQSFWFKTDANPPADLSPWVMVALPGEAEKHYFASEPVSVVFASNNVALIYQAYGKKLQARLRPSSYVPVHSTPAVPHPLPFNPDFVTPVAAAILSPWEDSIRKVAESDLPCVDANGEVIRHSKLTIPIPLDLYTDYLIDIEMLDEDAPDGTKGDLVWRGSFSTGGFRLESDFANSFQISKLNHRGVHSDDTGKLQAIGTQFATRNPQGSEFDNALLGAGLEALPVPKVPGFTIFWDPTSPPQPAAILVDASEPMWRERPLPTKITDPGPAAAQWYEMKPQPWLELVQQAGGDDVVDHIVMAPGGQRALVTLKPNARGKRILLALEHLAHTETYLDGPAAVNQFHAILDAIFTGAPWEEVD